MNLLFDLGNSRCKWARAESTLQPGAPLSYGPTFIPALESALADAGRPTRALAVSVAGATPTTALADWLASRFALRLEQMHAQPQQCGVTNTYEDPAQLGADRWAALIGARARTTQALCVVNCGTAVTIDALDASGVFRGGVIVPGLATQRAALLAHTHGIRVVDGDSGSCLARRTADAVAAGTLHGLVGAIERILSEQARLLGVAPRVLLSGGDAAAVHALLKSPGELAPHLVLEGLQRLAGAS